MASHLTTDSCEVSNGEGGMEDFYMNMEASNIKPTMFRETDVMAPG